VRFAVKRGEGIEEVMNALKEFFRAGPRGGDDPVMGHYFEAAVNDPAVAQVWCYTDRLSYRTGDRLRLHLSSSAPDVEVTVTRDGASPRIIHHVGITGRFHPAPEDCSIECCGWPVAHELQIPAGWPPGGYIITVAITRPDGTRFTNDHLFLLRGADRPASVLLLAASPTWLAYNDWGGSNHYEGLTGPRGDQFSPLVSLDRPWAKGFVRLPPGAPRIPHRSAPGGPPRYPHMEWAHGSGHSKKYASAGWASYERHFAGWAEREGIALDYATLHDLESEPDILAGYRCAIVVGHDEYWSWPMRDAIDAFVESGGTLARFAGNYYWQVRLADGGRRQICYKYRALEEDPLREGPERRFTTTCWDAAVVGRPAALTMGLSGAAGIYAGWSRCAAQGAGGFTVYRPEHWSLAGAGLGYGDVLGAEARIFGYEVDGLDYTFRDGLPFPTHSDGAPRGIEIVAMAPATTLEAGFEAYRAKAYIGDEDARLVARTLHDREDGATLERVSRGSGMMAEYRRGRGVVFNAASCEWVAGLIARDPQVEQVTRNVLKRLGGVA
jgi:hypothetical protein